MVMAGLPRAILNCVETASPRSWRKLCLGELVLLHLLRTDKWLADEMERVANQPAPAQGEVVEVMRPVQLDVPPQLLNHFQQNVCARQLQLKFTILYNNHVTKAPRNLSIRLTSWKRLWKVSIWTMPWKPPETMEMGEKWQWTPSRVTVRPQ